MEAIVASLPDVAECAVVGAADTLRGQVGERALSPSYWKAAMGPAIPCVVDHNHWPYSMAGSCSELLGPEYDDWRE